MVDPYVLRALVNGLVVAGFTGLGSLAGFIGKSLPRWGLDFSLGFSAGIMLVASFISLVVPALEAGYYLDMGVGLAIGALTIVALDLFVPHEHLVSGYEGPELMRKRLKKALLVALAIAVHNIPEGIAVGVTSVYSEEMGLYTTIAIGLQDVPEGAAVALPLAILMKSRVKGFIVGLLSGLIEMLMAVVAALVLTQAHEYLGFALGFSAGAMVYIVVEEILPEILHESSMYKKIATAGFFAGFYIALYLEHLLG